MFKKLKKKLKTLPKKAKVLIILFLFIIGFLFLPLILFLILMVMFIVAYSLTTIVPIAVTVLLGFKLSKKLLPFTKAKI